MCHPFSTRKQRTALRQDPQGRNGQFLYPVANSAQPEFPSEERIAQWQKSDWRKLPTLSLTRGKNNCEMATRVVLKENQAKFMGFCLFCFCEVVSFLSCCCYFDFGVFLEDVNKFLLHWVSNCRISRKNFILLNQNQVVLHSIAPNELPAQSSIIFISWLSVLQI